ncbi:DUF4292 domain-containing protein [Epilithonimonas ginsengisoli]|uniref:DUF4292 domain-containing protein n=1 Tax=Epilithonimonas ginsengisoli TaxID=1245592 RepID=A0ABU4JCT8_9FLAO|nr:MULTISPECIES: DUF4292 domain-containing protein [Chryseobacterium group]MBV6878293.1 DUF4292 domain-containing protein [Epilithonimonas sp. FP105]MDW8547464.1 DUF4292 domain-containing protein [Epilithonimonas ginsengisoli]OAH68944.1 hypothetical protein AXA65_16045 [Chryseobacterium sp. FP211-J200]
MQKYILIIVSALLVTSCKVQKNQGTTPISTTKPISNNASFFSAIEKKSTFDAVKINSKIDAKTGSFIPTLDAVIYIENGQKVWMNLTAVILQAARGVATPEGIKGYYKLDKTYIDSDFGYLNKLLNVNFIDYNALQNLLLGKTFIPVSENDYNLTQNISGFNLTSKQNQKITENGKTTEYKISLDYDAEFNLSHVLLSNPANNDQLEITYSNREILNNESFPRSVKIIIKANKTDEILLENTKFDFSRMETTYSVPANYKKTEIK